MKRYLAIGACLLAISAAAVLAEDKAEKKFTDLKLFEAGTTWKVSKVNGKATWDLGKDGDKSIGTMNWDFSDPEGKEHYVLASTDTSIPEGATQVTMNVRMSIKQRITFRLVDSTGQTHQFKSGNGEGSGKWEPLTIPLNKKLEHWGGDKDGKIHFPIKSIAISIPAPAGETKKGKTDFADLGYVK